MTDPRQQPQKKADELEESELEAVAGGSIVTESAGQLPGMPEPYAAGTESPNCPGATDRMHVKKDIYSY